MVNQEKKEQRFDGIDPSNSFAAEGEIINAPAGVNPIKVMT